MFSNFIRTLRPTQWTKNLFVFAGIVFSLKFFEIALFLKVFYAFIVFCLLSSVIYIINDNEENKEGLKGGLKTAALLTRQGQIAKIVIIPKEMFQDKIDIADYIISGHGKEEVLELCNNSLTYIDYKIDQIPSEVDPVILQKKLPKILEFLPFLSGIVQDNYTKKICKKFKINKGRIRELQKELY